MRELEVWNGNATEGGAVFLRRRRCRASPVNHLGFDGGAQKSYMSVATKTADQCCLAVRVERRSSGQILMWSPEREH